MPLNISIPGSAYFSGSSVNDSNQKANRFVVENTSILTSIPEAIINCVMEAREKFREKKTLVQLRIDLNDQVHPDMETNFITVDENGDFAIFGVVDGQSVCIDCPLGAKFIGQAVDSHNEAKNPEDYSSLELIMVFSAIDEFADIQEKIRGSDEEDDSSLDYLREINESSIFWKTNKGEIIPTPPSNIKYFLDTTGEISFIVDGFAKTEEEYYAQENGI